jgi:hypothetical protein
MTKKNPNENSDSAFSSEDPGKASEQNDTGFSDDQIQAAIALSLLENNQESKFTSPESNKWERLAEEPEKYYNPFIHGMDSLLSDVLGANEHVGLESRGNYPTPKSSQSTLHQEADLGFLENYDFDMSKDTNKITLVEEGEKTILIKNEREIILNDDEKGFLYNDILSHEEIWENRMVQENLPKTTKPHSQNFSTSSDDEPMAKCGRPRASSDDEPMAKCGRPAGDNSDDYPPDLVSSSGDEEGLGEKPSVRKVEKLDSGKNKKGKDGESR